MNWDAFALGVAVGQLTTMGAVLLLVGGRRDRGMDRLWREWGTQHPMGTEIPTALRIVPDQWPDVWDDPTSGRGPQDGMGHVVETKAGDDRE